MSGLDLGLIGWAPHFLRLASNLQDWGSQFWGWVPLLEVMLAW